MFDAGWSGCQPCPSKDASEAWFTQSPIGSPDRARRQCSSSWRTVLATTFYLYEERVADGTQNRVKTIKKHLHSHEKRTTISGA
jgi:hypothetical protein